MFSRIVGVVLGLSLLNCLVTSCFENQLFVANTGRTCCVGGGVVLEFIIGVTTSRRAKLPMALFIIMGGGVGDEMLFWKSYSVLCGLGNMA